MTTGAEPKVAELKDEELEQKLDVLYDKKDKTDEERAQFTELKKERSSRYQKAIDISKSKQKEAEYKAQQARDEAERLKQENEQLKNKPEPTVKSREQVKFDGKAYYTDEALQSLVTVGEMTDAEAFKHQRERDKAEAVDLAFNRMKTEQTKESEEKVRTEDRESVLREYPRFSKDHPDFDADDPLYKEASRIWNNGYKFNPKGLSEAVKDAKKNLGMTKKPDNSDDHNVFGPNPPRRPVNNDNNEDVKLTEYETNFAIKQYCRGDVLNPKTKRPYTEKEAVNKMLESKKARVARGQGV